ncbi:hypothetical protein JHK84_053763 [Glycine max]|nr:hypothetical protein JHK84_053763 [Glycine max]
MRELYEASLNGCVSTLDTLIKKDPPILSRVSLYPFTETPLHIASLLGHLEFCQILLQNSPNLATELDSKGRCSLHLASAKGHTEIVKALLRTKPEMSLVRDKDAMLPFHFAAIRGRVGAIKELIEEKPNSIQEMIESDDGSVLHLCVRYNHLQALNLLVESLRGEHQFLSAKYKEDSTILLSAVKHRQIKVESPQKKFRHCGCGLCLATGFSDIRFLQFFASLCVMLVLMSGFPLENKVVMWILAVLMIVAASCMLFTFTSNIAAMEILEDPKLQDAAMRELYEASMNGSLLRTNPEMCLVRDKDEMLPLHFAAMRGRVEVIRELIKAKPNSIREMTETDDGSVLHLSIRYNHLEALKLRVESLRDDHHFLSLKDKEDNSLLHLAVKRRQIKIIKYLLSLSEMSMEINALNREGLKAMDMLERYQTDFVSQHTFIEGVEKPANEGIAQVVSSATLISNKEKTALPTYRRQQNSSQAQSITIELVQLDPPPQPSPQQTSSSSQTNINNIPEPPQPSPSNGPHQLQHVTSQNITSEQGQDKWNRFERFCKRNPSRSSLCSFSISNCPS